jgi:hypothetical protein
MNFTLKPVYRPDLKFHLMIVVDINARTANYQGNPPSIDRATANGAWRLSQLERHRVSAVKTAVAGQVEGWKGNVASNISGHDTEEGAWRISAQVTEKRPRKWTISPLTGMNDVVVFPFIGRSNVSCQTTPPFRYVLLMNRTP